MRIAYDLRYAADHFTGIGTHAFCLLEALLERPGDERYVVLWDPRLAHRRYPIESLARHPRIEWHERRIAPLGPTSPWRTGAWLRETKPDVYLSPFYFRPEGARVPSVLTIHDVWPLRLPEGLSPIRHALYRMSLARAARARFIVTSSEFSRGEIVERLRVSPARVRAIRLGVPPVRQAVEPRAPAGAPAGPFALVVGDNRPRKNLATLAGAWARFGAKPPLALVSAGPASARWHSLEQFARASGASGVAALGWMEEPELEWLYRHAAIVLFPSLYEGFGFPLVEAYARGLPTIASDIPTLREIGEGATDFVRPHDTEAWAEAVVRLAGSESERARRRDAGLARAATLTYRTTAEHSLALLREAAGVDSAAAAR